MPEVVAPTLESARAQQTKARGTSMREEEKERQDFVLAHYAICESGNWYAAISCRCTGKVCPDEVLRDRPCLTPEEAMSVGREHIERSSR